MTNLTAAPVTIRACPVELLVRNEFGAGFDAFVRSTPTVRLVPGIFVDSAAWHALPPWEKYLARVHAVHRRRPDAVFVLDSAAALLGLPVLGRPQYIHVLADHKGAARITGNVQGHYLTDDLAVNRSAGLAHTSLLATAIDLARTRHPAYGRAVLDHACRVHGATAGEFAAENDARVSSRGRTAAIWAIERASRLPESVLESVSLSTIEWLGFEAPQLQVAFDLGVLGTARVDMYWPRAKVIGEADGDSKYRMDSDDPGTAVLREKKREDALRRQANGFARWGWQHIAAPAQLDEFLSHEGVPRTRPRDSTRLRTLQALLRA